MASMIFKMSLITALMVGMTAIIGFSDIKGHKMTLPRKVFIGILYGLAAVLSTHFGVKYNDMVLNVRDIAPLAAGLFFDPLAGIIAGLIGGIERYIAGTYFNVGSYTRIACSVSTCLAGFLSAALHIYLFKRKKPSIFYAFSIGAVMEVFHMYVVFITHRNDMKMAFYVVDTCSIPMIIFTGIGLAVSSVVLIAMSGQLSKYSFKRGEDTLPLNVKFQAWLLVFTILLLVSTFAFSFDMQTRTALQNARNTMEVNTADVSNAYYYLDKNNKSAMNLIKEQSTATARIIAENINQLGGVQKVTNETATHYKELFSLYEVDITDDKGIIIASSKPDNIGFDLDSSSQSRPFMEILGGQIDSLAQDYMPTGKDSSLELMYVGVGAKGGIIQIALDDENINRFTSLADFAESLAQKHVGENGAIYVLDTDGKIVLGEHKGASLWDMGVSKENLTEDITYFSANVFGVRSYCRYQQAKEGFALLTCIPFDEIYKSRNSNAYETAFSDILLFTLVFILIYILVQKIVVDNLNRVNDSLAKITNGNLNEVVNVRSSVEFTFLSDDINRTVDALKGYIDQAEKRIEQELEFARQIQASALPNNFKFPRSEFDLFATMDPAKEVGGDFYDFFFVDKNKIALVIADVSGKGIPASLFMMRSKTAIKGLAETGASPSEIFQKANNELCEGNDADMFVTAWIGIVDLETGLMQCANAGHEYPAIMHKDGEFELVKDRHGMVLGGMEGIPYKEYEMTLVPGDKLFVYTDGVPEAINESEVQFGTDELLSALNACKDRKMSDILPFVRKRISNFVGMADQFDDITMLGFELYQLSGGNKNG